MSEQDVQDYQGPYGETDPDKPVKVDLYDANEGKVARDGGPYQDQLVAEEAERRRAKVEDREPDLDNPGPTAATQLVAKHQLVERDTSRAHYSDALEVETEPVTSFVVEPEVNEPDPTQADWDNDQSKVDALRASKEWDELKEHNASKQQEKSDEQEVNGDDEDA